ncbi:MAG TPA: ATP-binding protein, partial [Longimicrobium sp.]
MQPTSMKYNPAFLGDEALIASFVARGAELARIVEVIRDNTAGSNQHVLVIGPRGIGKTTLVLRSAAEVRGDPELRAAWYPVVFGEETYQVTSPGEFWLEALFQVGEQTGVARWKGAHEELIAERDEDRLRLRAIAQLMDFADEQRKRLLLVVENLNMLLGDQIDSDDVWVLRQTLMNEPRIMLLATATSRFEEIDDYNSALYEMFRIIQLEPLEQGEAQA